MMATTLLDEFAAASTAVLEPLTVDQYHAMREQGILPEGAPIELIDGLLVRKDRRGGGGDNMAEGSTSGTLADTLGYVHLEPLTVDQYHAMTASGILPEGEPIELIDGLLVRKDRRVGGGSIMTVGPRHAYVITCVAKIFNEICESRIAHTRVQVPITLPPKHEPEPDVVIVKRLERDYIDHHPGGRDVAVAVEVAESSLSFDRGQKAPMYAAAGIPCYLVINLKDDTVIVHRDADEQESQYRSVETVSPGATIEFSVAGETVSVQVSELLGL